ncbi:MAG TPA: hypothetical protein PKJ30_02170 [Leptospiraceae bacterium]|nr:hypothetical protein [Leptospiraceae bacterium]
MAFKEYLTKFFLKQGDGWSFMCNQKTGPRILACALSFLCACTTTRVTHENRSPASGPDPVQLYKLKVHYEDLPAAIMQKVRARALANCRFEEATKTEFLGRAQYRSGPFEGNVPVGKICLWNFERELFQEGAYDRQGALAGTATHWYGERLRQYRRRIGATEISRSWYWTANGGKWTSVLVELSIVDHAKNRRIDYVFSRDGSFLVSRRETLGEKKSGLQYNAVDSRGKSCVFVDALGSEREIALPCPLPPSDVISGGESFED